MVVVPSAHFFNSNNELDKQNLPDHQPPLLLLLDEPFEELREEPSLLLIEPEERGDESLFRFQLPLLLLREEELLRSRDLRRKEESFEPGVRPSEFLRIEERFISIPDRLLDGLGEESMPEWFLFDDLLLTLGTSRSCTEGILVRLRFSKISDWGLVLGA